MILLLFALSPLIALGYLFFLTSIHLGGEDVERLLDRLDSVETTMGEIRGILSGRFEIKKQKASSSNEPEVSDNGPFKANIDVSQIQFKQKAGAIAGPHAKWGWAFAYTQNKEYHDESRELVQAIEQYEKVQMGNRIFTLGGRDGNLLNFKEIDKTRGARANDGSS